MCKSKNWLKIDNEKHKSLTSKKILKVIDSKGYKSTIEDTESEKYMKNKELPISTHLSYKNTKQMNIYKCLCKEWGGTSRKRIPIWSKQETCSKWIKRLC